jgi:uncharacterized protein (DUF362 family)
MSLPVFLSQCPRYQADTLAQFIDNAAGHLSLPAHLHGSTVLLKPNLVTHMAPSLACTHRSVLVALSALVYGRRERRLSSVIHPLSAVPARC